MVAAKGPLAPPTAVPLRLPTVDHDIPSAHDTALRTGRGVAELLPRVHARLQVTGCSGCVTRNARWTRLLSIPPPPQRCSTVEWGATRRGLACPLLRTLDQRAAQTGRSSP